MLEKKKTLKPFERDVCYYDATKKYLKNEI